ncbi:MAG: YebG family protein [Desulfobacterales bacterium]|nr:YebG family protein [Desulfobacterales bacterium]
MAVTSKQAADAYDRMIEAAAELAELIAQSGVAIGEYDLEDLTIYLAQHSLQIIKILAPITKPRSLV